MGKYDELLLEKIAKITQEAEGLTIAEWRVITRDWNEFEKALTRIIGKKNQEERETIAEPYFLKDEEVSDWEQSYVQRLLLANPALSRLIRSLS